jgi:uncharacterized protein YgbK (DUF1537 family)
MDTAVEDAPMTLGVIADDFTGGADVASMLVRSGMRTQLVIGVPDTPPPATDAVVVALKSRAMLPQAAVRQSLAALRWLQTGGMRQCYFKYRSTFDSTPAGNIGPVAEALMQALGADFTIACPATPENGRTVFRGHLFVDDQLLSESGMRDHPLTPMRDPNLVRVLQAQARGRVGLIRHGIVARGAQAVRGRIAALKHEGISLAIVDAIDNDNLRVLADACSDLPLVTAGSGLALGLLEVYARCGWTHPDAGAATLDSATGRAAVLSGSCSRTTQAQVAAWRAAGKPAFAIDPLALGRGEDVADRALTWAAHHADAEAVLIHSTMSRDAREAVRTELGRAGANALVEACMARVAQGLADAGVGRMVVAGGDTASTVVLALGARALHIGPSIYPGVPWTQIDGRPIWLAMRSGNFGGPSFFEDALRTNTAVMPRGA